jgi:hypothetical protein
LRFANIFNGLLLMFTAIIVFFVSVVGSDSVSPFAGVVISVYIMCVDAECAGRVFVLVVCAMETGVFLSCSVFGVIMICVELNIANLQPLIKEQFGFMFTYRGRALFILFAATMAIARNEVIAFITGGLTAVNAVFNMAVICVHPAWKEGGKFHKGDVTQPYSTAEDTAVAYVRSNPELASRAGHAAGSYIANNPDVAREAAFGAARGVSDAGPTDRSTRSSPPTDDTHGF